MIIFKIRTGITTMRKIILISSFLLTTFLFSQIKIISAPNIKAEKVNNNPYDSLSNYLGTNVYQYIGQELYLKNIPESRRYHEHFVTNNSIPFYNKHNKEYKCNIVESSQNSYNNLKQLLSPEKFENLDLVIDCKTNIDSIIHKYYKVFDIIKHPKDNDKDDYTNKGRYYLGLLNLADKDSCYYVYESESSLYSFPFIVKGYFEKQKTKFINKKFVVKGKGEFPPLLDENFINIESGNSIPFNFGEEWECIDIALYSDDVTLIMQNKIGEKTPISINDIYYLFMSKENAENIKKKYGLKNWNLILGGRVLLGWNKELCELSWGFPNEINKTITKYGNTEQWVYSGGYLYFSNNKLVAIQ